MSWFNRKSLRKIRSLIEAIRVGEYNIHFSTDKLRGEERLLTDELNSVVKDFRDNINRQEALYGSYEAMLNQMNEAVLAVNATGHVMWMNRKAVNSLCGFAIDDMAMLRAVDPSLPETLNSMMPGQDCLISININGQPTQLRIAMVRYIQAGEAMRLFTIENIQQVIQQSENEAQRKLVSVLTHEIMNSLSPIISLSETLSQNIKDSLSNGDEDNLLAIDIINRRSRGLLSFVENYRKLSRVSTPRLAWVKIGELIEGIDRLMSNSSIHYNIEDPDLQLRIDPHQIEQVLINLLKNSIEACKDSTSPEIQLICLPDHVNRNYLIKVRDNGTGISSEALDNIFTPFFTTKPHGSGIGLSLSRQIIMNHGGLIKVSSAPGNTLFTIQLPLIYKF